MINHHPHEATLAAYAAGTLSNGMALVVAAHLQVCPSCRALSRVGEALGGTLLSDLAPAPIAQDALDRVLARAAAGPAPLSPPPREPTLPAPLRYATFGPWRRVAVGMRIRTLANSGCFWAGLVEGAAGRVLPSHGHPGLEATCVLSGRFADAAGRYTAGDLIETGPGDDHEPTVDADGPCVCLIATEGVRLHGILGFLQRVAGL